MIEHLQIIEHMLTGMFIMVAAGFALVIMMLGYIASRIDRGGR